MKIVNITHVEDCFDGSYIKEILFTKKITEDFINSLSKHGKLSYYKSFARPFFKVKFYEGLYMKGVEGNKTARLLLQGNSDMEYIQRLFA